MIARINFATRERPAVQPAFSNGYRQHGSTIKEALALADLYMPGQPLAPEDVEVIQLIIDKDESEILVVESKNQTITFTRQR